MLRYGYPPTLCSRPAQNLGRCLFRHRPIVFNADHLPQFWRLVTAIRFVGPIVKQGCIPLQIGAPRLPFLRASPGGRTGFNTLREYASEVALIGKAGLERNIAERLSSVQ